MATGTALLDDLAALVGGRARTGGDGDHVGGVPAPVVAAPSSTDEAAAVMRACADHDLAVAFRGQGTALHWGAPPRRLDVLIDTGGLDQVVEHVAGDLVAVVQAGLRVDA
ncbi:MAG: FAD-binding protein, partial [Actinomycetota bacterium]